MSYRSTLNVSQVFNEKPITHHTEFICGNLKKDRVTGVVLGLLSIGLGVLSYFLLKGGYSTIPTCTTGCFLGISALGLFAFSIVLLFRRSEAAEPNRNDWYRYSSANFDDPNL